MNELEVDDDEMAVEADRHIEEEEAKEQSMWEALSRGDVEALSHMLHG